MNPMAIYYNDVLGRLPVAWRRWAECGSSFIFGKMGNDLDILVRPSCSLEGAVNEFRTAQWDVVAGEYAEVDGHWFSAKKRLFLPSAGEPVLVNALVSLDDEWVANMAQGGGGVPAAAPGQDTCAQGPESSGAPVAGGVQGTRERGRLPRPHGPAHFGRVIPSGVLRGRPQGLRGMMLHFRREYQSAGYVLLREYRSAWGRGWEKVKRLPW